MGFAKQTIACAAILVVAAAMLGAGASAQTVAPAKAPENEDGPPAKKKDPAVAERAYAAGVKAFEAGKMGDAIQSLSAALSNGGLPAKQMAKALYFRGSAYRKQEKPAQAISDLTTAVWLKGGLSDADRAQAIEERQMAYREAGLGDTAPPINAQPLDAPATVASTAQTKTAAAAPAQQSSFWSNLLPWSTSPKPAAPPAEATAATATPATATPAPAAPDPAAEAMPWQTALQEPASAPPAQPAPAAPAPPVQTAAVAEPSVPGQIASSFADSSSATPPPQPAAFAPGDATPPSPAPSAAPLASPPPVQSSSPLSGVEKAVTGFFGNVFGSSSNAGPAATPTATPSSPVATSATATSSAPPQWQDATIASAEPAAPEALPWSTQSAAAPPPQQVAAKMPPVIQQPPPAAPKPAKAAPPVAPPPVIMAAVPEEPAPAVPAAAPPPPVPVTASASTGRYRLQVAAVRSRDEAERLASSVMKHEGLTGAGVSPEIDEAVLGSMGTFYRVRLGPYADAAVPGQLCKSLRPQGYDCLVVTQ